MKKQVIAIVAAMGICLTAQAQSQKIPLTTANLTPHLTKMSVETQGGKDVVRVVKSPDVIKVDEPTYVRVKDLDFKDGIVELKVMGRLLPEAPDSARAFIGLAFRINADDSKFEGIYLRPTNGIAMNQIRRNRSVQYFSYPDFKFSDSRKVAPGEFESYADIAPDVWIKLKIVVQGSNAQLFINDSKNPNLIVNNMKMGAGQSGALGLWVDIGTEGYFKDLIVTKAK